MMKFTETELAGVFVVDIEGINDDRGYFARTWSESEFRARGLDSTLAECSISFNRRAGTIRGMHWQEAPHQEVKLVRCSRGSLRDIVVDLRPDSATYLKWTAVLLTPLNARMVYVPNGCAHGFETTADDTEVVYSISSGYVAESARGFRWNDPAVGIQWLSSRPILSNRDQSFPDLASRIYQEEQEGTASITAPEKDLSSSSAVPVGQVNLP